MFAVRLAASFLCAFLALGEARAQSAPCRGDGSKVDKAHCEYIRLSKEGKNLKARACSQTACIYRLAFVSKKDEELFGTVWEGSGYKLEYGKQFSGGAYTHHLLDPAGGRTVFKRQCGASCSDREEYVSGPLRGASFTMPLGRGGVQGAYVVLRVPR